ncbi:monocyte to macrophage differentiation factor 2-like [Neocloeon triangulifer]|uniref:monocyte to macrophage differentiation factor 2-like n=1 Tax=Neocloeon triangulifer TaxID=2078957 RepID=UPI00286F5DBA|nr:monocyte to macrophage differentiation factor 2-like [Neocloeon triangulifer]
MNSFDSTFLRLLKQYKWMNERAPPNKAYNPTTVEHIANVITNGIWIPFSIWGGHSLLQRSTTWPQLLVAVVYSLSIISIFTVSTTFHCALLCQTRGPVKDVLHRCDRAMIYIFIAASYFPWLTLTRVPPHGLVAELWWLIWVFASVGILYQQIFHERFKWLETTFYLIMGIAPGLAFLSIDVPVLFEIQIGGLFYIAGVFFFKMDGRIPFAHAIWHLLGAIAACIHLLTVLGTLYDKIPADGEAWHNNYWFGTNSLTVGIKLLASNFSNLGEAQTPAPFTSSSITNIVQ